jgi:hypothetical protein
MLRLSVPRVALRSAFLQRELRQCNAATPKAMKPCKYCPTEIPDNLSICGAKPCVQQARKDWQRVNKREQRAIWRAKGLCSRCGAKAHVQRSHGKPFRHSLCVDHLKYYKGKRVAAAIQKHLRKAAQAVVTAKREDLERRKQAVNKERIERGMEPSRQVGMPVVPKDAPPLPVERD